MTDRVTRSIQNGLLMTIAWVLTTIIYVTLRYNKVEAPEFGNAFVTVTGAWITNLGIVASRKAITVKETAENAEEKAEGADIKADKATVDVKELREIAVKHHPEEAKGGSE